MRTFMSFCPLLCALNARVGRRALNVPFSIQSFIVAKRSGFYNIQPSDCVAYARLDMSMCAWSWHIVSLCFELLMRLSYYIHLLFFLVLLFLSDHTFCHLFQVRRFVIEINQYVYVVGLYSELLDRLSYYIHLVRLG